MIISTLFNPQGNDNCVNVLRTVANCIRVRVTDTLLNRSVKEHPDYPSLFTVSETLNNIHVDNLTLRADKELLDDYPTPFLTQLMVGTMPMFTVVKKVTFDSVICTDSQTGKWKSLPKVDFFNSWNGIITLVEPGAHAGQSDYKKARRIELGELALRWGALFLLLITCGYFIASAFSNAGENRYIYTIQLLVKMLGTMIGVLFLGYEINKSDSGLNKMCSAVSYTNCEAVMESKAAKLLGLISWGEASFFYFSGGLLLLLLSGLSVEMSKLLNWLSILTIPVIGYSIFYQWRIVKQWCLFCLIVVALLSIDVISLFFISGIRIENLGFQSWGLLSLSFAVPFFSWMLIKKHLLAAAQGINDRQALARMKSSSDLFQSQLVRQKKIEYDIEGLGIVLGSTTPSNVIVKVCNPYCSPCARAHTEIEKLLELKDDLQVRIIFTASERSDDLKAPPVKHLLAIAALKDSELLHNALHDWYNGDSDYSLFSQKYPMVNPNGEQAVELERMKSWCDNMGISFTPTIFLNGYQLPDLYNPSDIKHFV